MHLLYGGVILVTVGALLRRILRLNKPTAPVLRYLRPLGEEREAVYQPVALELETQSAILGVSLNDAIEERDSGNREIAWRLVRLSASEWERMAEIVTLLLSAVAKHAPVARVPFMVRSLVASRFRSRAMVDYARMHEVLDQLVFRSKLRFQLHVRVLRRAVDGLTSDFQRAHRDAGSALEHSEGFWTQLDLDFHDFDLITKETLLAFRTFLACLPDEFLDDFAAELEPVIRRGVRSTPYFSADRRV